MRPPAGVECAACREEKQHRCQAQVYAGRPLCLPCLNGDPCVIDRVGGPRLDGPEMFEIETPPAPVIHRTPEELGLPATVPAGPGARRWLSDEEFAAEKRKAFELAAAVRRREKLPVVRVVKAPSKKRRGGSLPGRAVTFPPKEIERRREDLTARNVAKGEATRVKVEGLLGAALDREVAAEVGVSPSRVAQLRKEKGIAAVVSSNSRPGAKRTEEVMDEMREAVKKLGGTMSDRELGEKLGVSGSRVGQLRKELGIAATKPGPKGKKTPKKSTALIHPGQRAVEIDTGPHPGVDALAGEGTVRVSIEMTRAQACERFGSLTPAQMGIALEAAMKAAARS
jgi:hypothetical protein